MNRTEHAVDWERVLRTWRVSAMRTAVAITPPALAQLVRRLIRRSAAADWEYSPNAWDELTGREDGWNHESVARIEVSKWRGFERTLSTTAPLGLSHESTNPSNLDIGAHNTMMAFGYVIAMAARTSGTLSVLDWGGGLGHYFLIAKTLVPNLDLNYSCADLPLFCEAGRRLLPDVTYYSDDDCFARHYDLVFASSSLQYCEDWRATLSKLAAAADKYLFITRLPTIFDVPSFPVRQRPHRYGYETEYVGWFLNRGELLDHASLCEMELVREFLVSENPQVRGAPEQCHYRGFLFRSLRLEKSYD